MHIIVVVAGYETAFASTSSCKPGIWAHYWGFEGGKVPAPVVYGKTIGEISAGGGYVQVGEWHCADLPGFTPGYPATMGVIAHEFGHSLNLPDLYDTSGRSSGIGVWGLMGMGTWNTTGTQLGDLPAHHDAWSKWYEGWTSPLQLRGLVTGQPIPNAESNPTVFQLLDNPNGLDWKFNSNSGTGEYFLVENRQQTGFDAGLPGCGLLIWHIDESVPFDNSANAGNPRRLVYLVQADGSDELGRGRDTGDAGDPFPGSRWNQAFSASSNPNSNLYNGSPSSANVLNISGCASTMTADFLTPGDGIFADITPDYWAVDSIEKLYQNGITQGCGVYPLTYCPESSTTRAQMAIFLLRSKHGSSYVPPAATGTAFADVSADHWAAAWIEQLVAEGITAGCGDGNYCPEAEVTRAQMAVFLLRSKYGGSYTPPAATGTAFTDVPADYWAAAWIEQLVAEGITAGCGNGNYCPESAVTRAQMAVFLVRTFNLP
ncbi:MAG: S-layer homology domain-containing protein [Anaerolineales bacterium]|nr:S-layer homology domain-containing protein [Anaerolineales bacterium]